MTAVQLAERSAPSAPLRPRPDQAEHWLVQDRPLAFADAAALVRQAHDDDGHRNDLVATDLRTWAFGSPDDTTMALVSLPLPGRDVRAAFPLREHAFAQLCTRIGAPAPYIRALPPKLQVANVNYGLARTKQNALLRLAGDDVRAVVSEKYVPLDDNYVLDVVDDVLRRSGYHEDAVVRAVATGKTTVLRITVPTEGVAVKRDDVIEFGIDVSNSELGLRSVQVTPVTFRLACTNGLRAWRSEAAVRMRHIGDPDRLHEALRDAVPVAFAEARGDIEKWKRAVDVLVDSALEEIEELRHFGLSQGEVQAVGRSLVAERGLLPASSSVETITEALKAPTTVYEVVNGITGAARDRTDVAARLAMEEVGHRYLTRRAA